MAEKSESASPSDISDISTDDLFYDSETTRHADCFVTPSKKRYRRRIYFDSVRAKRKRNDLTKFPETNPGTNENHSDSSVRECEYSVSYNTSTDSGSTDLSSGTLETSNAEDSLSDYSDDENTDARCASPSEFSDISDSGEERFRHKKHSASERLFAGSRITQLMSSVMIILFVLKHGLGKEAFSDLLVLLNVHMPQPNKGLPTIHKIKQFLRQLLNMKDSLNQYFCDKCQRFLDKHKSCIFCQDSSVLEFADLRLEQQLADLVKDDTFRHLVKETPDSENCSRKSSGICDITDGTEHKRVTTLFKMQNKPSSLETLHLTFTMNTDGVALFSSAKKGSLWPVYLAVNELPIKLRFSKKYIIPCFLYCQVEKPNMATYQKPLMTFLQKLSSRGIEVVTNSASVQVFGQLLVACLDLPAKAMVANMKQFNGKSACSVCLDEGEPRPNLPMLRSYPFTDESVLRTHHQWLSDAHETIDKEAVQGIKGMSVLATLSYVDLPKVFAIDWMHCVLLGVVKALMRFWFDGPAGNEYYIGDKVPFLNKKLQAIKVPDFIARTPRTLADHSHWKASECREWLFHFSVPLLVTVMKPVHLVHYSLLVTSMVILNSEEIQPDQLQNAEDMIMDFCRMFPEIYGAVKQTMNVHLLKHLPHFVRLHGPLFTTSCFGFESMNSHLKNMVHGTRHVNKQVTFAVNMAKSVPSLVQSLNRDEDVDEEIKSFLNSLAGHSARELDSCSDTFTVLGAKKTYVPDRSLLDVLYHVNPNVTLKKFFRLQTEKGVVFCREYDRVKRRNSYSSSFVVGKEILFGFVDFFLEAGNDLFAVVTVLKKKNLPLVTLDDDCKQHIILKKYSKTAASLCTHITCVSLKGTQQLVSVSCLKTKCVYIPHASDLALGYMSVPPNLVEHS